MQHTTNQITVSGCRYLMPVIRLSVWAINRTSPVGGTGKAISLVYRTVTVLCAASTLANGYPVQGCGCRLSLLVDITARKAGLWPRSAQKKNPYGWVSGRGDGEQEGRICSSPPKPMRRGSSFLSYFAHHGDLIFLSGKETLNGFLEPVNSSL